MTPIFGDNMSPTGFGSVPCEKLEVLLDGERLQVLDWQGGGRFGVPLPNCGGRRGAASAGLAGASGNGSRGRCGSGICSRRGDWPDPAAQAARAEAAASSGMRFQDAVRFKTTAGPHASA